ncbi:MAG TPA: DNA repair protein RadC [Kiritimatiellia bacterium]|nr:DNA repair protein RadC [Kiritimatiellia bacterium]HMO97684.1 DNA repair protein RadC [Kiritimatiellia bacterium]HMP95545.1 DNA repair protein RadC [Kiritimatiellia bacterium]
MTPEASMPDAGAVMVGTGTMPAARKIIEYPLSPRRIKDLPEQQRPRETFDRDGPEQVNDRVLLAILIRNGIPGHSAVDIADDLLNRFGSLPALAREPVEEIARIPGMGKVKAQIIKAALELSRRLPVATAGERVEVRTPGDAARLIRSDAALLEVEQFWVILLDTKYRLRRPPVSVSKGILDACLVHPREVFKEAIRACAAAVVLVHNHPSGDSAPSREDLKLTRQLIEVGRIMDIEVLDHVIVGAINDRNPSGFTSLRESGLVSFSES